MLNDLEARGRAAGVAAAERARSRVAQALSVALPGVEVLVAGERIYLSGRLDMDDERLRWIASLLR